MNNRLARVVFNKLVIKQHNTKSSDIVADENVVYSL